VVETGEPFLETLVYADIYTKQNLTQAFDIRVARLGDGFVAAWRVLPSVNRKSGCGCSNL